MIDALRFEWVRLRTLRSTYWLTGLALVLSAAVAGLVAYFSRDDRISGELAGVILTGGTSFSPLPFTALFMGIFGVFAFGHEYRHGLILPTLAAVPRRGVLVLAKVVMVVVWSLVVAVVGVALNWTLARVLSGQSLPLTEDPVRPALVGYLCFVALWGLLGLGLGSLLRNLPAAMVLLFVVPLVVEPLISALSMLPALEPIREYVYYLPFNAGKAMAQTFDMDAITGGQETGMPAVPSRLTSGLTFTAWVVLVLGSATALFHKRDA
ncbi:ABC transporter permease [Actinopolymorpha alba]|uniref:ABC transporter permease n=1 Tax=Actinopolymorpha alba TaxID=533267 RepID=UPI000361527C|nr:ABC transporter permease [Actinopolymorpha alba]